MAGKTHGDWLSGFLWLCLGWNKSGGERRGRRGNTGANAEGAKVTQKSQKNTKIGFDYCCQDGIYRCAGGSTLTLTLCYFRAKPAACFSHPRAEPASCYRHPRAGGNPQQRTIKGMDSRLRGNDGGKAVKRGSAKRKPNPTQAKASQNHFWYFLRLLRTLCVLCVSALAPHSCQPKKTAK